jgi:EthD domain
MQRLLLLLTGARVDDIEQRLRDRAPELETIVDTIDGTLRRAVQLEGDPMSTSAPDGRTVHPLDALVEVTVPGADPGVLVPVAGLVAAQLGDTVDWTRSAVSIGVVRTVLPAACDTVLLTLAAHRSPALDRQAFHAYWLDVHAVLAMSLLDDGAKAAMGYQQVHAHDEASADATASVGARPASFDGILQCALSQIEDLPHLTVPGFAEAIMEDEANFADQSAEMLGAFMRTLPREGES